MSENSSVDLEFVSPFPLSNCVQRLDKRHENATFFAWNWQRRLWVKTWKIREGLYGFKLMYVDKNGWLPISYCSVKGYLKGVDGSDTAVLAQKHINYLFITAFSLFFGIVLGVMTGGSTQPNGQTDPLLVGVLVGLIGGGVIFLISWFDSVYRTRMLIGVVEDSLGGMGGLSNHDLM